MAEAILSSQPNLGKTVDDLKECINSMVTEYNDYGKPIHDGNKDLQRFCVKLEFLLDRDQVKGFLGGKKDYWSFFLEGVSNTKGLTDGIKFVKSLKGEVKTNIGRGRAFLRFCLMYQKLADVIQLCLSNHRLVSEYYSNRSIWREHRNASLSQYLISSLYDLNDIVFDLAPKGYDLDNGWPTFARGDHSVANPAHNWSFNLSRASSQSSLSQSFTQSNTSDLASRHSRLRTSSLLDEPDESLLSEINDSAKEAEKVSELERELRVRDKEIEELNQDKINMKDHMQTLANSLIEKSNLIETITKEHNSKYERLLAQQLSISQENSNLRESMHSSNKESTQATFTALQDSQVDLNKMLMAVNSEKDSIKTKYNKTQADINKLKAQLAEKTSNVKSLQEQLMIVTESLECTLDQSQALEKTMHTMKIESKNKEQQRTKQHQDELKSLEAKLQDSIQTIATLESELAKAGNKTARLESQLKQQMVEYEALLTETTATTGQLSDENERAEERLKELNHQLTEKKRLFDCLQHDYNELESTYQEGCNKLLAIETTNEEQAEQLEKAGKSLELAKSTLQEKDDELRSLQKDLIVTLSEIDALSQKLESLETSGGMLAQEHTALQIQLADSESNVKILEDRLERESESVKLNETETRNKLSMAYAEIDVISSKLKASRTETNQSVVVLETVTQQRDDLEERCHQLQVQKDELEASFGALRAEISSVREDLKKLRLHEVEKSRELSELQTQLESTKLKMKSEHNQSEQQMSSLKFQLSSQQMEAEVAIQGVREQQAQVFELRETVSAQERLLAALEIQLESLVEDRGVEIQIHHAKMTELSLLLDEKCAELSTMGDELDFYRNQHDASLVENQSLNDSLIHVKLSSNERLARIKNQSLQLRDDNHVLKKRLVKLIKDKDSLWKRTDELVTKQRRLADIKWIESSSVANCMGCRTQFTVFLRKHHCRLCGRVFCWQCSNNWLDTTASSGKSRVCNECFIDHTQAVAPPGDGFNSSSVTGSENDGGDDMSLAPGVRARNWIPPCQSVSSMGSMSSQSPLSPAPSRPNLDSPLSNSPAANSLPDNSPPDNSSSDRIQSSVSSPGATNSTIPAVPDPTTDNKSSTLSADSSSNDLKNAEQSTNHSTEHSACQPVESTPQQQAADVKNQHGHAARSSLLEVNPPNPISPIPSFLRSPSSHTPISSQSYVDSQDEFDHVTDEEVARSLGESSDLSKMARTAQIQSAETAWDQIYYAESLCNHSEEAALLAGTKHTVCINVTNPETTLSWSFSSLVKSIQFGLEYRYAMDTKPEMLIPLCKCNSHKQDVAGEIVAHNTGLYIFIFSNESSRLMSKTVIFKFGTTRPEN